MACPAASRAKRKRDEPRRPLRRAIPRKQTSALVIGPDRSDSQQTPRWRRQSGAIPSLKWDFRNNARFRGVYSTVTAAQGACFWSYRRGFFKLVSPPARLGFGFKAL